MITDPRFAPKRTDLPWLRHRVRPKAAADATAAVSDFLSGHADHPHRHSSAPPSTVPTPPVPTPPAPTPSPPAAASSLDLSAPASAPPATTASPASAAPAAPKPPAVPAASSTSLDLDAPAPAPPLGARAASPAAPSAPPRVRRRTDPRVRPGDRVILRPTSPTVTLTRMQSGIGTLAIEAACSAEVGDLRLGAAYELADGTTTTVQMAQGERFAPPHSRRPILVGTRSQFETITVDLRQVRSLRRLAVYAFSESRAPLTWGGTLIVTTFGGARVEAPLEAMQGGTVAVLMTCYVVDGECVLRAEMQSMYGDVREASRAYGYDSITWVDDRTPVI